MHLATSARRLLFNAYHPLIGSSLPTIYADLCREDRGRVPPERTRQLLVRLLAHCRDSVPYYSELIQKVEGSFEEDPESYLAQLPVLTKDLIQKNFEKLKSSDLASRKWFVESSSGSTGVPIRVIQDRKYLDQAHAIAFLYSRWAGLDTCEPSLLLWGSTRDIFQGSVGLRANISNLVTNITYLNAFRMTKEKMREYVNTVNTKRPRLIIAYAQSIYELARFAEAEGIAVVPQSAIITSANTLYPFMREKIETVFQCKVFDRYGSREVGDIACECSLHRGLHVAPWGSYVEIVNDSGGAVPAGTEGNILITCLTNYAMPLIRYRIGDLGIMSPTENCSCGRKGQLLERVSGRASDNLRTRSGRVVTGVYFVSLIGVEMNDGSISKFQIVQESYDRVTLTIVKADGVDSIDTKPLVEAIRMVMDESCQVDAMIVDKIPPSASGKYLDVISKVKD